jgi:hypothetical protein
MSKFRIVYQIESKIEGEYFEQGFYFKGTHYPYDFNLETLSSEEYWQEISEIGLDGLIRTVHSLGIEDPDKDCHIFYSIHLRSGRYESLETPQTIVEAVLEFNPPDFTLTDLSIRELKAMASKRKVKNYGRMKKSQLVEALT